MRSKFCLRILLSFLLAINVSSQLYSQAANNTCANAVTLTPASTCTTIAPASSTTGNLQKATSATTDGSISGSCGGATTATTFDVWYKFSAVSSTTTITITLPNSTNLGTATTYIELLNGVNCAGFTSLKCQDISTPLVFTALTIGTTYYVRVYTTTQGTSNPVGKWDFDICILNPPANDDCSNSILLYSNTSCSNTSATLAGATASAGIPLGCAAAGTYYDVWFSFVAANASETITLSSAGGISSPAVQLYSGSCGALTSISCGTTSIPATGLSVGSTYFVRVSNSGSASSATFNICITHAAPTIPNIDYGKSYVNITNNTGGGTIDPGDTLEIRATLVIRSSGLDSLAFLDTLHLGGGVRLVPGSIALRTNEGKVYKSFTDAVGDDEGYSYTSGTDTVIKINFGTGASATKGGTLLNNSKPSVFGSTCIIMATYRVVVYAVYSTTLNLGGGKFITSPLATGTLNSLSFSSRNAVVYSSPGLCPNSVAASNAIGGDFNGTFGSGTPQNRGASSNVTGYTYSTFTTNSPGDYYYGIANNTSAGGSSFTTVTTWPKPDNGSSPTHRVFNLWDISGDHTSATNTAKGNRPCDPTQPISATNPCGYMLVVNSAYKTDTAFQYTVNNLCPNTYYEISAWLKNICYKCGCDSNGVAATASGYIPSATNDSSGVQPNITFDINGVDYYTTGNIQYGGLFPSTQTGSDSNNVWVKRGFTYLTGAAQTSFTLTIRNNAPGGGGNDWAMDDIALATCSPNVNFTPTSQPTVCSGNSLDITGTVTSYFNNYTFFKWQKSTDNGATWVDETGTNNSGSGSPTYTGGQYEYAVNYSTAVLTTADNGILYRLITATTATNLTSSTCILSGSVQVTPTVNICTPILGTSFISFNAKQNGQTSLLNWTTSKETESLNFIIEGSNDGRTFIQIGTLKSSNIYDNALNSYSWSHAQASSKYYYRIKMVGQHTGTKYSKIVGLEGLSGSANLVSVTNPFQSQLIAGVQMGESGIVRLQLMNNNGVVVQSQNVTLQQGNNWVEIKNISSLPSGMYTLKLITNENVITKKLIRQ